MQFLILILNTNFYFVESDMVTGNDRVGKMELMLGAGFIFFLHELYVFSSRWKSYSFFLPAEGGECRPYFKIRCPQEL